MNEEIAPPDAIHRLAKAALDNGRAFSIAEAEAQLRSLRIHFHIDRTEVLRREHQATLLTGVALARRVFLGGVFVSGDLDAPLTVPLPLGITVGEAVLQLGASARPGPVMSPLVYIGGGPRPRTNGFAVRTACAGWRGGILPAESESRADGSAAMPLAAMLSASLAVNEAFLSVSGDAPISGRRSVGMSLWRPSGTGNSWLRDDGAPQLAFLPSQLWLIGLGHLGQANLWALGLLPYSDGSQLQLLLQDFDVVTPSTWSTSVLTEPAVTKPSVIGMRKTRLMATWAEQRGFVTAIHERHFDARFMRHDREPSIALCGVDNALARRALDKVGFDFAVSAGLGSGHQDFRTVRLHTLPGEREAADIWRDVQATSAPEEPEVYAAMVASGALDRCGAALLAGKAVGAPFVGAVAAALVISEVLRLLHGGQTSCLIDLDLRDLEYMTVIPQRRDFSRLNPGFVEVAQ